MRTRTEPEKDEVNEEQGGGGEENKSKKSKGKNKKEKKEKERDGELSSLFERLAAWSRAKKSQQVVPVINPCDAADCDEQSDAMLTNMNASSDPCENFYEYACGGYLDRAIPMDHVVVDVFTTLSERIENRLKILLENQAGKKDNKPVKLAYDWYSACLDVDQRNNLGIKPMMNLLKSTMNSDAFVPFASEQWPAGENWDFIKILSTINRNYDIAPFFVTTLSSDPRNASSPTHITITEPTPILSSKWFYLLQNSYSVKIIMAYLRLMLELGKLLGANDIELLVVDVEEIILFEAALAKEMILSDADEKNKATKLTVAQLQKLIPTFDWLRYFNELYQGVEGQKPVTEDEVIFVVSPKYFVNAMYLISRVRKSVLANYMAWQLIYRYSPYLSTPFHDAYLNFAETAYGLKKGSPLWRRCVRSAMKSMDMAVAFLYVNDSMTNETIQATTEMVDHLKNAFIENLDKVKWMDSDTRTAAEEKAEAMFDQVGYPDFITNMTLMEEYFKGVVVNPKTFFRNKLIEDRIRKMNSFRQRGAIPSRYSWGMLPTEPNAYYSPNVNKMVVSAAIMQPPFFDKSYPEALNYGALGFVVGHEMTHGFDDKGAQCDKNGNLRNWWSQESLGKFKERTKCMEREYSEFSVQESHVNGKNTLGENIADNGGLKFAYMAYKKWLALHGEDEDLPNVHLSHDQLFFLSFAQVWCERSTNDYAVNLLKIDEHSPAMFRVMGTLKNSNEFSEAFSCKLGSGMNPEKKCTVW